MLCPLHLNAVSKASLSLLLLGTVFSSTKVNAFSSISPAKFTGTRQLRLGLLLSRSQNQSRLCASKNHNSHEKSSFHGNDDGLSSSQKELLLSSFDPLNFADAYDRSLPNNRVSPSQRTATTGIAPIIPFAAAAATTAFAGQEVAWAADSPKRYMSEAMNPANFQPVCATSDGFYRFLQGSTEAVVGQKSFVEYGPLIAGGLLRIRLELCVVESFFAEAVGPFIKQNGVTWILPLHETVETFLAGTIFSLATTFILVGSTKIVTVIITYADVFVGGPFRLFGGFFFDRSRGKPVTLDIGFGPFKKRVIGPPDDYDKDGNVAPSDSLFGIDFENSGPIKLAVIATSGVVYGVGKASKLVRKALEAVDLFVGRYLVLIATGYIGFKFVHFKVFPDFPPFG